MMRRSERPTGFVTSIRIRYTYRSYREGLHRDYRIGSAGVSSLCASRRRIFRQLAGYLDHAGVRRSVGFRSFIVTQRHNLDRRSARRRRVRNVAAGGCGGAQESDGARRPSSAGHSSQDQGRSAAALRRPWSKPKAGKATINDQFMGLLAPVEISQTSRTVHAGQFRVRHRPHHFLRSRTAQERIDCIRPGFGRRR